MHFFPALHHRCLFGVSLRRTRRPKAHFQLYKLRLFVYCYYILHWGGLQWHNVHTKFRRYRLATPVVRKHISSVLRV